MSPGYSALHQRAAWLDLSGRGKLAVRGPDRVRLVHALTTNDIQGLMPGQGCYAFLLNAQGKVLADANIFCLDDQMLLDTEAETRATVFGHVDGYIIADDATVHDVTDGIATLSLEGPDAEHILASAGVPSPEVEYGIVQFSSGWVARVNSTGQSGFFLFVSRELRAEFVQQLENSGAVAATGEDARTVRLENGRPRYGAEITARYLALETAQNHAIHPNKGCYLGQEVVERVRSRGVLGRVLVSIVFDSPDPIASGTKLFDRDARAGEVASSAYSPVLGRSVGLAYVKKELAHEGAVLFCGQVLATIAAPITMPAAHV